MKSARLIARVCCLVLLCAPFAAQLGAQKNGSPKVRLNAVTTLTPFTAIVTKNEAQFILPVPIRPEWKWRLAETKDNMMEYQFAVSVENEGRKYNFGFYLWKRAGAGERAGSFSELMRSGQLSVFGRTPAGRNEIIRDAGIKFKLNKDMLILAIRGKENVERLFSAHPAEVTFEIKMPDEVPAKKTVAVVYQD